MKNDADLRDASSYAAKPLMTQILYELQLKRKYCFITYGWFGRKKIAPLITTGIGKTRHMLDSKAKSNLYPE